MIKKAVLALILLALTSCKAKPNTQIPSKLLSTPDATTTLVAPSPVPSNESINSPIIASVISGKISKQIFGDWLMHWSSTPVRNFTFDKDGTIWIGWHGKAIYLHPEADTYTEFGFKEKYDIREFEFDKVGAVWVGVPIFQYLNSEWTLFEYHYTTPMNVAADNTIWATSTDYRRSDCVVHFDKEEWTQFCPEADDVRILDLETDNENTLWISLRDESFFNEGVWKLKGKNWESIDELEGTNMSSAFQISLAPNGTIWFVSSKHTESGENGQIRTFDGNNWLLNIENTEMVSQIKIAPDNTLWGYGGNNLENYLLKLNNYKWEKVLFENDLESIFGEPVDIYSFGFDPSSNLCLGTSIGLICKTK